MSDRIYYADLDRSYGPKKIINVFRTTFVVGVNMPWGEFCGHDFGLQPYGFGQARNDWGKIGEELKGLAADGITVVRWWILAGGINYPNHTDRASRAPDAQGRIRQAIDDHAHRIDDRGRRVELPTEGDFEWVWNDPQNIPPLSEAFFDDFVELCRACQNAGVQLMPSLLSFEWFDQVEAEEADDKTGKVKNKGIRSRGRRRLVFGQGDDKRSAVQRFLKATLEPLVAKTTEVFGKPKKMCSPGEKLHPIFAWEIINEPDWVVKGGPYLTAREQRVAAADMNLLLEAARRMVLVDSKDGYDFSIGFKAFDPPWLSARLRKMLIDDGTRYWHQGHHYPTAGFDSDAADRIVPMDRTLPVAPVDFVQCLVGELATAKGNTLEDIHPTEGRKKVLDTLKNWRWGDGEVNHTEADDRLYLRGRLQLIASRRYAGALAWSTKTKRDEDNRTNWSSEVRAQVRGFAYAEPIKP